MRENLDDSLKLIFGDEGGYSNVKTDSGGPTKYGVTHKTLAAHRGVKAVTAAQVQAMTIQEAEAIYRKSYWGPSGGDVLPSGLDYAVFDAGVNSGPPRAVKILQQVLKAAGLYTGAIDGWIGPGTLQAVDEYPGGVTALIKAYCDQRMAFLRSLKGKQGFPSNGRGWTIRVTGVDPKGQWAAKPGVVGDALAMARNQPLKPKATSTMPAQIADAAAAKAEPKEPNKWLTPEMVTTVGGGAVTAGGTVLASGMDPIRLAVAVAIVAGTLLAGYFIFMRLKKAQEGVA